MVDSAVQTRGCSADQSGRYVVPQTRMVDTVLMQLCIYPELAWLVFRETYKKLLIVYCAKCLYIRTSCGFAVAQPAARPTKTQREGWAHTSYTSRMRQLLLTGAIRHADIHQTPSDTLETSLYLSDVHDERRMGSACAEVSRNRIQVPLVRYNLGSKWTPNTIKSQNRTFHLGRNPMVKLLRRTLTTRFVPGVN